MNVEKMKEIFSDEAFVKSLFELETVTEVQAALKEKGIELSEEEILGIREFLIKVESGEITQEQLEIWQQQAKDGELSDEALEQVTGGIAVGLLVGLIITGLAVDGLFLAAVGIVVDSVVTSKGRRW